MSKPNERTIVERWLAEIVLNTTVDENSEYTWEGVWCGFVIGAGRPDLANYDDYRANTHVAMERMRELKAERGGRMHWSVSRNNVTVAGGNAEHETVDPYRD